MVALSTLACSSPTHKHLGMWGPLAHSLLGWKKTLKAVVDPWECQQFGVGIHLNQAGYMARALFLQEGSASLAKPKMWPIPASWLPQLSTQQMSFQRSFRACLLCVEQGSRSLSFGLNSNRKRPWIEQSICVGICWMLLLDGNSGFLFVYVTTTLI